MSSPKIRQQTLSWLLIVLSEQVGDHAVVLVARHTPSLIVTSARGSTASPRSIQRKARTSLGRLGSRALAT